MSMSMVDIVTVYHNDGYLKMAEDLAYAITDAEPIVPFRICGVDNRIANRGFAGGCNYGAVGLEAPVLGFLNPDTTVHGPFLGKVLDALSDKETVITGERFGKSGHEIRVWGCHDWVCGAAFFVKREWFEQQGGFDPQFVWGWEETDLIRQAQSDNKTVRSISLPLKHSSPTSNSNQDKAYKDRWFNEGAERFYNKWGRRRS